jgi:adenylate kinase
LDGKVVLITGAAGTGKSTLVTSLLGGARPFKRIDYGQLLLEHKAKQAGIQITYDELRRDSAAVITPDDVFAVDEWVIGQLPAWRAETNIIIDSHPVTKEAFGYRVTPYSLAQVARISFDVVIVLVGDPPTLANRMAKNPQGRPPVDSSQVGFQVQLQAAIASMYGIVCGRPVFAINTTALNAQQVTDTVLDLLEKAGVPFKRVVNLPSLNRSDRARWRLKINCGLPHFERGRFSLAVDKVKRVARPLLFGGLKGCRCWEHQRLAQLDEIWRNQLCADRDIVHPVVAKHLFARPSVNDSRDLGCSDRPPCSNIH